MFNKEWNKLPAHEQDQIALDSIISGTSLEGHPKLQALEKQSQDLNKLYPETVEALTRIQTRLSRAEIEKQETKTLYLLAMVRSVPAASETQFSALDSEYQRVKQNYNKELGEQRSVFDDYIK